MMPFAEKLTFLMHICQTGNKDLAQELGVDPSMVSLMRTGKRRLSKDPAMAEKMGLFFAQRCSAPFQRQALAETLGQLSISPSMPTARLAASLSGWLRGEGGHPGRQHPFRHGRTPGTGDGTGGASRPLPRHPG